MRLSQSQVYAIAVATGLPNPKLMAAIAMAESSGDTSVVNSIQCVGLWQINQPVHVKAHPKWTIKWLQNPFNDAAAAKVILKSQGLGAWEVYTGPDGVGSDGPYRKYANVAIDTSITPDDLQREWDKRGEDWDDPLPDMPDVPGVDALDAVGEALEKTANVLVNPQTWLRIAYGAIGVVLIAGGLFLIVKSSPVVKSAEDSVKALAGAMPQKKVAKAAGAKASAKTPTAEGK